ncbi:MAG: alanine--tRNA ligase [Acidimicrobiia bacterium]
MRSDEIRRRFLRFFSDRDHAVRPSASLIPTDPTLLLTGAGMVPFKAYFLGDEQPPWPRAVSVQKCARTVDIDVVGTTARHFTFFEMLGNFSFGDYFKEKAIPWAYEFVIDELGIDTDLLWFTVHETDDEAEEIWIEGVGVSPERVQRRGKDNFWQMGVPGPCGPSSEIFVDRGREWGPDGGPVVDEERFVEIWNLVFMQNIQDDPYHVIGDLPARNIDTGSGLERVAMVLQGADSVFEIDTVRPLLGVGEAYSGVAYGQDAMTDVSLRLLADHGRSVTFLISDGVMPSNEGRGYVLRRLLRRAVRHAWQLDGEGLIMPGLVDATVACLADGYPELVERTEFITEVVSREETRFRRTLESGHQLLDSELGQLEVGAELHGTVAFRLHDTYGFPIELTSEIASERGVDVDLATFEQEMAAQRERARAAWQGVKAAEAEDAYRALSDDIGPTNFLGYEELLSVGRVLAIVRDGETTERAEEGEEVELFLDRTPFYAESGGQVGDIGVISTTTGTAEVRDTQAPIQSLHGHLARIANGYMQVAQDAEARVDVPRREAIAKSHTGTHLLHSALREVVGDHVQQAGSLVTKGRLRFDFSHFQAVSDDELDAVASLANRRVIHNDSVSDFVTSRDEAEEMGALAFFGDKYGDQVRVVRIGEYSLEFCVGTHTPASGSIGPLVVTSESSIGANTRRVEALTGQAAYDYLARLRRDVAEVGRLLSVPADQVAERTRALVERNRELMEQLGVQAEASRSEMAAELADGAEVAGDSRFVVAAAGDTAPDALRMIAAEVRGLLGSGVVVLGATHENKGALVAAVSKDLVSRGVSAGDLVSEAARELGGGGSKDPELAQAGGPHGQRLESALEVARKHVAETLLEA